MHLQLKHDTNYHSELATELKPVAKSSLRRSMICYEKLTVLHCFYSPLSPSDASSIGTAFRKPLAPSAEHVAISRSHISVAQRNSSMATSTLIFDRHLFLSNVRRPPTCSKVAPTVEQLVIRKPFATEARTCCQAQRCKL